MSNNGDLYSDQWQTIDPEQVIQQAINKLADDAGAVLELEVLEAFKLLYQENPASYNRYRQQVKESKQVTMPLFDKLTSQTNNQVPQQKHTLNLFPPIEQWDNPVKGEQLLNEIKATIKQYVIADEETIIAATLWVAYTWFIDVVSYAPIANITAPEKRCGKTKLLSVLKHLSYKAFSTANITTAPLFRMIEMYQPTLFIDEVDTFLALDDSMRGVINAGFTRDNPIVRCVGEDLEPTPFNVWGAKALCGIGKIADTLQDRSITLKLRRKTTGETVANVDKSDPKQWATFRAKLARFAHDNKQLLIHSQIEPLPQLNDRANDCWEPLRQVAQLAGGHWPQTAIKAAIVINGEQPEDDSTRTELLRDIKTLFDTKRIDRIFSHELVNELNADNEANWCTWNKNRGITARNLAKILKEFDIASNTIRIGIDQRAKGYSKDQFKDTFKRYLTLSPTDTPATSVTTGQIKGNKESSQNNKRDISQVSRIEKQPQGKGSSGCHFVTDKTTPLAREYSVIEPNISEKPEKTIHNLPTTHSINELMDEDDGVYFDLD